MVRITPTHNKNPENMNRVNISGEVLYFVILNNMVLSSI